MTAKLLAFWRDEKGSAASEYALAASLIAAVIAITVGALGTTVRTTLYDKIIAAFSGS